jgi:hypothetical protein
LWLAAAVLLSGAPAFAQRTTASVRGTVTDQSHGVVPGVTVTATNTATGLVRTTITNGAGLYSFPDLPVGVYQVDAELSGFKKASRTDVILNVADDRAIDFELQPGTVSESVTVQASSPLIRTVGGDVSGVITGTQVRELPLNGRNFLQLATLMPGVSAPDFLNVKDKGLLGGSDLSVSGSSVTSNLWTVDGANVNDVGSNRTILVYPSTDAIEEFKILRNSYGPEFGQAGGAQINIVTRSGTNTFHGSGFYAGRNDKLNATNYFLVQAHQPKEELKRNDFGGTFGGPIIKDKLQFFYSQEWNREKRGSVRTAFVPTAAERVGDFSASIPGCTPPTPIDPLTGAAFPGNRIPGDRLSPGGQLLLKLYPLPNTTPSGGSCNNWVQSLTTPIDWRQENVRLDYTMSSRSRVMVRYTQDAWTNNAPNLQSNLWGDDPFPAVDSNWDQPGRSFVAQLNQSIGEHAVNTLQFSYSANKITVTRGGTTPDLNDQINAAIPTLFPSASREYGADRGHPVFWGGQSYTQALWNEAPFHNNQDLFILKDDYSVVFGKHVVKAGGLASFNKKNEDVGGYGSYENSEFWGSAGLNGWGTTTGNIMADFLLKDMTFGFDENSAQHQVPQRWRDTEFYVSDSWKAAANLTIDYGLRYSLFLNPYAADNRLMSFDPTAFKPTLGSDPCNGLLQPPGTNWCSEAGFKGGVTGPNRSLFPEDYNNFAPRIGAAWDVSGNSTTVLRAGLGQFYLRERLSPGLNIGANPPFRVNVNGIRKLDTAAEPCGGCFAPTLGAPGSGREQRVATPNNWQWNVALQRAIVRNTTLEVAYVGNKGSDLLHQSEINQVLPGDINHNGIPDRREYAVTTPALAEVRPYGVFGDARITMWDHSGRSMYHSLQTQLVSRFGRGSQLQVSYTLSRTLSNDPLDNSDGGLSAEVAVLDRSNPDLDYGRARTDRRHIFNTALVWVLPSLEGSSKAARSALGDWEVAAILGAASGQPLSVHTGSIPGLNGGPSGTGYTDNQRPNQVAGQPCHPSGGLPEQILNPAAYTLTNFVIGTIGDSPRGQCEGPAYIQADLALYKNIAATNRVKLQLRFEVFNVFNRANFIGTGGQGVVTTMNPSVTLDAPGTSATKITTATPSGKFGQAQATRDPRQAQFGFKLLF